MALPKSFFNRIRLLISISAQYAGHGQQGAFEADQCQQGSVKKEADTLECVLQADEDS
ncbi:hypothetical protein PG5_00380 [Pseudomonas sp. G5(2012)]|nr:hypothetical protein PG5_00380 [Pseudomonas sp. G5(2012)]